MTSGSRAVRRSLGRALLVAIAAQALGASVVVVGRSVEAAGLAWRERGETRRESLLRHYPAAYLESLDEVRERVDEEDYYLIVDAEPEERGAAYVANYFLAPRRGVLIGRTRLERGDLIGRRLAQRKLAEWVVWVPAMPRPPELLDRDAAAARIRALP